MKKLLLSFLSVLISLPILAQTTEKPLVYDYDATKHEIAIDIVPIFGGNLPTSFFYRKNYLSSEGNQKGLRLNLTVGNYFKDVDHTMGNAHFSREALLDYMVSVGTEWQKPIVHNFIGYSGLDFGVGYNSRRLHGVDGLLPGPNEIASIRYQNLTYNVTGFWGVKYHILARLSVFAEMGIAGNYWTNRTFIKRNVFNPSSERIDSSDNFSLNLLPLRALRVAYHF